MKKNKVDLRADQRLLSALAARIADRAGYLPHFGNGLLAGELGVSWDRLKMWRVYRGVPAAFRYRVAMMAKEHGLKIDAGWIDISKPSGEVTNGGTSNGRKAPAQKQARQKRSRAQQRQRRPGGDGSSRRGAPASP